MASDVILSLSCSDRPGIVAAVSTRLFEAGCNILEAHQYDDPETLAFFMRVRFATSPGVTTESLSDKFKEIADSFGMTWNMRSTDKRPRVLLLVSKLDHCLADLLYRWRKR
jgi:formyltetrahydrofolate deformylase